MGKTDFLINLVPQVKHRFLTLEHDRDRLAAKVNDLEQVIRKQSDIVVGLRDENVVLQLKLLKEQKASDIKIVIGSDRTFDEGWIATEQRFMDMLKDSDWQSLFNPGSITAILAEHVWEHLTPEQGKTAFANCFKYLKPGGYLRVAVPDGFKPDPEYIENVKPGGKGAGADDHKLLYDYKKMSKVLKDVGFEVKLLEYYDEDGEFHFADWNKADGTIHRSKRYDRRNQDGKLGYTSLIIDAVKPEDKK